MKLKKILLENNEINENDYNNIKFIYESKTYIISINNYIFSLFYFLTYLYIEPNKYYGYNKLNFILVYLFSTLIYFKLNIIINYIK